MAHYAVINQIPAKNYTQTTKFFESFELLWGLINPILIN